MFLYRGWYFGDLNFFSFGNLRQMCELSLVKYKKKMIFFSASEGGQSP